MKTKLTIFATAAMVLVGCGKNSSEYKELKSSYDSLQVVADHYESDLSETDSLVAAILTNFQEINSVENMISLNDKNGDMRRTNSERIKDNIKLINDKLQASSDAINDLSEKLKKSGSSNKRLALTVAALRKQLTEKTQRIEELVETLQKRNSDLIDLDNQINSLNSDMDQMKEAQAKKEAMLKAQEKELNTVTYCIGTSRDLKDLKVVVDGKVTTEKAEKGYFTSIDKRDVTNIPLGETSKAKLLTLHPESSYKLQKNADKTMNLIILDKENFWRNSKVLVIEVY